MQYLQRHELLMKAIKGAQGLSKPAFRRQGVCVLLKQLHLLDTEPGSLLEMRQALPTSQQSTRAECSIATQSVCYAKPTSAGMQAIWQALDGDQ